MNGFNHDGTTILHLISYGIAFNFEMSLTRMCLVHQQHLIHRWVHTYISAPLSRGKYTVTKQEYRNSLVVQS